MAVLLSTDVFSLIDDDLIVPFDTLANTMRTSLAARFLPGVPEERRDRRPYLGRAVPALDHRAVLEQGAFQDGGPRSRSSARDLGEHAEFARG